MKLKLYLAFLLPISGLGQSLPGYVSPYPPSTLPSTTTARIEKQIDILTTPADSTILAAAWLQSTGRRLAWTANIQSINIQPGTYSSSEFEALFRSALESTGCEVYSVTQTLDYVRPKNRETDYNNRSSMPGTMVLRQPLTGPDGESITPESADHDGKVISISAEIGSVTLGNTYSSGVDILAALDDFRVSNTGSGLTLGKSSIVSPSGATASTGAQAISRYVKLLNQTSDYNSIARPRMECLSGETATISTGQRVAVPSTTLTASFGGPSTSATITYQNVALSLEIRPVLLPTGRISLTIKQTDDSISGTQVISGNSVPTIASQKFSTKTIVNPGECIALGGIRITRTTKTATGPIGLSKIPLLGRLFRVQGGNKQDAELLILITARVR